jgi:hypothetical protein
MRRQILRAVLVSALCGCGGEKAPAPETQAHAAESGGSEVVLPDPEPEAAPAAPASGPATLKVVTKVGHDAVAAHVKVFDASGALLAEGPSGQALSVRSGDLEIEAALSDSKALRGTETVHKSISLVAGADATESVTFERCMVRVAVRIRGKLDPTAVVTLSKDGVTVAKLTSGDQAYVAITPGRYNASVKSKRAEIVSSDITLNEGATQTVPIDVN